MANLRFTLFAPPDGRTHVVRGAPVLHALRLFVLALLVALLLPAAAWAAKTYRAERFDVDLAIQPDGSLIVTESIRFRFTGGPFTYVFRDLAYTEIDAIDRLQASLDGQALPQGSDPGEVEIEVGDPLKVTWHLPPTSDAAHTFTLAYRVQGAIRQVDGADALIWRAIPEEHDYEIGAATITLRYPEQAELLAAPQVRGAQAAAGTSDGALLLTMADLGEDQDVVIEARFAPGALISAPPQWQAAQAERAQQIGQAWPGGVMMALFSFVVGGGWLIWFWRRHPRPLPLLPPGQMRLAQLPAQIPPAAAVKLASGSAPALAALFDLASRGILRIEETPRRWGRKFMLYRLAGDAKLRPHEQGLLEALFGAKSGLAESLDISKLGQRLAARSRQFNKPLEQEMIESGWLDEERRGQRSRLIGVTVTALLLGGVLAIIGLIAGVMAANAASGGNALITSALLVGLGGGLFLLGFIGVIAASTYATLTASGEQLAAEWRSFGDYLKAVAKGKERLLDASQLEAYLPYAAGLGLAERWAKRYSDQTGMAIPAWFSALRPDDSAAAFIAVMTATHTSVSSSGAGAGAAGASGGGASGAG